MDCYKVIQHLFLSKYILNFIWKTSPQSVQEEWRGTELMMLIIWGRKLSSADELFGGFIFQQYLAHAHSPKIPVPALMTMVSLCFTNQQTPNLPKLNHNRPNNTDKLKVAFKATQIL